MTTISLPDAEELVRDARAALERIGVIIDQGPATGERLHTRSPISGAPLIPVPRTEDVAAEIERAHEAFLAWRTTPAPVRGQLVRRFGELLREHKEDLAALVTIEVGKIRSEALGEVQEMIDVCEFAVGLSRQLDGRTMPSERPGHRLMETWHPLGVVGIISAFNFPVAVWAWNAAIALVCGDSIVWKPSSSTALTAIGAHTLLQRAVAECAAPEHVTRLIIASGADAEAIVESPLVPLVSATGSERMGAEIAPRIAARFGRAILELGGNNAAIVSAEADLDLAVRGIVFAAAGTAGQRCTTMRRVIAHESIVAELVERLDQTYRQLRVGNPLDERTLVGPLFGKGAFEEFDSALDEARAQGGTVIVGGERCASDSEEAYFVAPAIVRMPAQTAIVHQETFAPILYVLSYGDFEEAIRLHNEVPQGLSSSIFTRDHAEAERFMSAEGSDCGIVNVNIGTSGAEIGGAFGGEKSTGGGRESGSDAWRAYMRRATNTVNYSSELPLAQGVSFS